MDETTKYVCQASPEWKSHTNKKAIQKSIHSPTLVDPKRGRAETTASFVYMQGRDF